MKSGSSSTPETEKGEVSELRWESQGPWPGKGLNTGGLGQGPLWSLAQVFLKEGEEFGAETGNSDFIGKASRPRRWWTGVPKTHLANVWMLVYLIEQRWGVEEVK